MRGKKINLAASTVWTSPCSNFTDINQKELRISIILLWIIFTYFYLILYYIQCNLILDTYSYKLWCKICKVISDQAAKLQYAAMYYENI